MIKGDNDGFVHHYTEHKDDIDFTAHRVTSYPNTIALNITEGNQFSVEEIREIANALNQLAADVKAYDNEHYASRRDPGV